MSFVKVLAQTDGRSMEIVIPEHTFEESLLKIARELDCSWTWRALPQDSIEMGRSQ